MNALSDRMTLHQTPAGNLVNALSEEKLIRRVRADQRVVHLYDAPGGKRLLAWATGHYAGLPVHSRGPASLGLPCRRRAAFGLVALVSSDVGIGPFLTLI